MNLESTFCRYFYAERLLLPFSVEGQVSRRDERYLYPFSGLITNRLLKISGMYESETRVSTMLTVKRLQAMIS